MTVTSSIVLKSELLGILTALLSVNEGAAVDTQLQAAYNAGVRQALLSVAQACNLHIQNDVPSPSVRVYSLLEVKT